MGMWRNTKDDEGVFVRMCGCERTFFEKEMRELRREMFWDGKERR